MRLSLGFCLVVSLRILSGQPESTHHPEFPHLPPYSDARRLQEAHEQNLDDTSRLIKLSTELKWDLANNDRHVLSIATVKKMDEIERLIRKIRARVGKK